METFEKHMKPVHKVERNMSFWEVEQGPDKFSFPSGHASRSTFIMLIFAYKVYYLDQNCNLLSVFVVSTWWILICMSRLCLGRHFFFDILCGIAVGFFSFSFGLLSCNITTRYIVGMHY